MTDISLIAVLKKHGWKTHKTTTLKTWKKERLIEEIQALENNYACALEVSDNQYNLLLKMYEKIEQLKQENEKMECCYLCKKQYECAFADVFNFHCCDEWELAE